MSAGSSPESDLRLPRTLDGEGALAASTSPTERASGPMKPGSSTSVASEDGWLAEASTAACGISSSRDETRARYARSRSGVTAVLLLWIIELNRCAKWATTAIAFVSVSSGDRRHRLALFRSLYLGRSDQTTADTLIVDILVLFILVVGEDDFSKLPD